MRVDSGNQLLAGYTVVRTLGESADARVFLGFAPAHAPGTPHVAALKLFTDSSARHRADAEVAALARAQRPHVVALLDCATTRDGLVCLVLEHLRHINLAQLLAHRGSISPGELVTILAPIAEVVDGIHEAGVAHGGLRAGAVLFNDSGAPVLSSFTRASVFNPGLSPAALTGHPEVRADRESLAALVRQVVAHCPQAESASVVAWLSECERAGFPDGFGRVLAEHLYDVAEPEPLAFPLPHSRPEGGLRVSTRAMVGAMVAAMATAGENADGGRAAVGGSLESSLESSMDSSMESGRQDDAALGGTVWSTRRGPCATFFSTLVERLPIRLAVAVSAWLSRESVAHAIRHIDNSAIARSLGTVRKPVWFIAGGVALALTVALVVVPHGSPATIDSEGTAGAEDTHNVTGEQGSAIAESEVDGEDGGAGGEGARAAAIVGDDPIAAASALVEARQGCIRSMSIVCLDSVAQQGSVAMDDDVALIRALQAGAEPPAASALGATDMPHSASVVAPSEQTAPSEHTPSGEQTPSGGALFELVERLGATALVEIRSTDSAVTGETATASLLLMKGEAGWRIRSYVDTVL